MAQTLDIQINFNGKSPLVAGDKRLTVLNLGRLMRALDHGAQIGQGNSYIQVQSSLVAASATATCAAVAANDTLSIGGQALTATVQRANATLTAASAISGTTFVLNGVTFTGVTGAAVPGTATFSVDTSDTACAASIAAQIIAYPGVTIAGRFRAKSAAAVVTIFANTVGTWANGTTLVGTATVLVASASTLTGGLAVTINTFDPTGTNNDTAFAIAAAVIASPTAAVNQTTASAASAVVTVTSKVAGLAGNTITFTSSNGTRLAVTGSGHLASGSASAPTRYSF